MKGIRSGVSRKAKKAPIVQDVEGSAPQAASKVLVVVRFTGICGFVFRPDNSAARVVLPDAAATHHPHQAAILVQTVYWSNKNKRQPQLTYTDQDSGEQRHVLFLNKENIFHPTSSDKLVRRLGAIPGSGCPTSNPDSLNWIAKMADVAAPGTMPDNFLTDSSPKDVSARIRFTAGDFSTADFRNHESPPGVKNVIKWQFKNNGANVGTARAQAEVVDVALSVQVNADNLVEFSSQQFNGHKGDPFLFAPITLGGQKVVIFWVVNMPLPDILGNVPAKPFEVNDHFEHFYKINAVKSGPIPHPLQSPLCPPAGGGMSNPKCPPALYGDNVNA